MTAIVPLTGGAIALVEKADLETVLAAGPWFISKCGEKYYARRWVKGESRQESLHTFLTGWPYVDHRNGLGLDNRRENLRPATPSENTINQAAPRTNTSGYKGVNLFRNGRWRATIGHQRKQIHLGYFDTAEEAAHAYDAAALELYGQFARPNFPQDGAA